MHDLPGTRFPISRILVENRQREDYGNIDELKESLTKKGQLQPIGITPEPECRLLWGGRRLVTAISLGWTEIGVVFRKTETALEKEEVELEENLQRKDLNMVEKEKAIARIHQIKMAQDPNWTAEKTGDMLNLSRRRVFNAIELSSAFEKAQGGDVELQEILKADTATGAMQRLERIKDIKSRIEAAAVRELATAHGMVAKTRAEIIQTDVLKWLEAQPDNSLDCFVSNPPYGVDIEDIYISNKTIYGNDDPVTMGNLCQRMIQLAYQKLKDNRWMVVFWPTSYLDDLKGISPANQMAIWNTLVAQLGEDKAGRVWTALKPTFAGWLAEAGFKFQKVPAVWSKTGKFMSSLSDPYSMLNLTYETFYFARKGNAKFHQIEHGNVFNHPTVASADRVHPLEMSDELWEDIFKLIAVGGETVVEGCSGSGRASWAAIRLGLHYVGLELGDEYVKRSRMLVSEGQMKFGSVNINDSANNAPPAPQVGIQSDDSLFQETTNG